MSYPDNTRRWPQYSYVIHKGDAKKAEMLLQVMYYKGLTPVVRYVFPQGKGSAWQGNYQSALGSLLDPADFDIPLPAPQPPA